MKNLAKFVGNFNVLRGTKTLYQKVVCAVLVTIGGLLLLAFLAVAGLAMSTPPVWVTVRFSTDAEENLSHFREIVLVSATLFVLALSGVLWKYGPKTKNK